MSFRTVRHLCGHDARYRIAGGRAVVGHHLHELERSPCTPCAEAAAEARRHIYLGFGARVVSFSGRARPEPRVGQPQGGDAALRRGAA